MGTLVFFYYCTIVYYLHTWLHELQTSGKHGWSDSFYALTVVLMVIGTVKGDFFYNFVMHKAMPYFSNWDHNPDFHFLPPALRLQDFLWVDPMTLLFPLVVYSVADMTCIPTLANLLTKVKNKESSGYDVGFPGMRGSITSL